MWLVRYITIVRLICRQILTWFVLNEETCRYTGFQIRPESDHFTSILFLINMMCLLLIFSVLLEHNFGVYFLLLTHLDRTRTLVFCTAECPLCCWLPCKSLGVQKVMQSVRLYCLVLILISSDSTLRTHLIYNI